MLKPWTNVSLFGMTFAWASILLSLTAGCVASRGPVKVAEENRKRQLLKDLLDPSSLKDVSTGVFSTQPVIDGDYVKGRQCFHYSNGKVFLIWTCPDEILMIFDGKIITEGFRLYHYGNISTDAFITEIADFLEALEVYRQVFEAVYAGNLTYVNDRMNSVVADRFKQVNPRDWTRDQWGKWIQISGIHVFGHRTFEVCNRLGYFTLERRDGGWMIIDADYPLSTRKE